MSFFYFFIGNLSSKFSLPKYLRSPAFLVVFLLIFFLDFSKRNTYMASKYAIRILIMSRQMDFVARL